MAAIAKALRPALRRIPGAIIEAKGLSVSVHWRLVRPGDRHAFHRAVDHALARWKSPGLIRVTAGKKVVEIRPPVDWGKGSAVVWLARRLHAAPGSVMFIGDDQTDEDAFKQVRRLGGTAILVGHRRTEAAWRVRGPSDVAEILTRIMEHRWSRS
jgi:trehalose-phosphatase